MHDLNSLKIFRDVVSAGGYSAAQRKSGQSRATMSRHINSLEKSLGARLIERSTRSFRLTEQGQILYERSLDILEQLDEAFTEVENLQHEPSGLVRIAIPPSLLHLQIEEEILRYLQTYKNVRVEIKITNQPVDIHHENMDFVIRARHKLDYPLNDVTVLLARTELDLVAHPKWQPSFKETLAQTLEHIPAISWNGTDGQANWSFSTEDGQTVKLHIKPRLIADDISTVRHAVLNGLGIALIPSIYVKEDIARGDLVRVNSEFQPPSRLVHAVHLGHRGMRPAVRHLLDWLKEGTEGMR